MMPVLKREPLRPHGDGARRSMGSSTGFTLVEVVVSSSILAFALAGSFRGWSPRSGPGATGQPTAGAPGCR